MIHGLQDFLVSSRNQADGAQNLQNGDFGFDRRRGETLRDDFDGVRMRENVGSPVRIVHQSLNATDGRVVDRSDASFRTHRSQQVQETVQSLGRNVERKCKNLGPRRNNINILLLNLN